MARLCEHARNIMLYAEDAQRIDAPWTLWEARTKFRSDWSALTWHPNWDTYSEYRRIPVEAKLRFRIFGIQIEISTPKNDKD